MIITSQRVLVGGRREPLSIRPAAIHIEGSVIKAVETSPQSWRTIVDYGDRLITPAFVNAHTHLALGFLRGADMRLAGRSNMVEDFFFRIEAALEPEDVRAFVRMGAYESLLSGVGLVWDHYYHGTEVAAGLADVGLCGVVAPTLQDLAGPGKDRWERELEATVTIDADDALRERGIFAALGPHATDTVSEALFGRALAIAEARKLPLHTHLAQSIEEHSRCHARHGLSPVAWLDRIGVLQSAPRALWAHALFASRADLARLDPTRHVLVFCPYSQLVFGFPAPVGLWSELGIPWIVATDCASNNDSMNVQKELRFVAGQRTVGASWSPSYRRFLEGGAASDAQQAWETRAAGFEAGTSLADPRALLARVWSVPGAAHPACVAGSIEPGALANLIVWDLDHPSVWPALDPLATLAMADPLPAIFAMCVAGQRQGEDGNFAASIRTSPEYTTALSEARDRLHQLAKRLPSSIIFSKYSFE